GTTQSILAWRDILSPGDSALKNWASAPDLRSPGEPRRVLAKNPDF
ncbi:hypothetical protein A2U01_0063276, partial [Trifolium medium]|nr:hypothetical protein [Trifolium medium]